MVEGEKWDIVIKPKDKLMSVDLGELWKYHDLSILFEFFVQLWMYATPIVYPLSQVGDKEYLGISLATIMKLNPVTPVIETFKYGFLSAGEFIGWDWMAYSFGFMTLLLFFGTIVFNKVQKRFLDTV